MNVCEFSPDRRYRYTLLHHFEPDVKFPCAVWIGLNPSTADEQTMDQTMRKIAGFSRKFGYNGFLMLNLFAFRSRHPEVMKAADDPVGPGNDAHILHYIFLDRQPREVFCCWGNHGGFRDRNKEVIGLLRSIRAKPMALRVTGEGHPSHPVYLPYDLTPEPYEC